MLSKETEQEDQYFFPYHHLTHEENGNFLIFRHLPWGLEHYTYIHFVVNQISKIKYSRLIDIGCGDGRVISELQNINNNTELIGIDVSKRALAFAKVFAKESNFFEHDIINAPFNSKFDIAISCDVIEHISPNEIPAYIQNISKTLNPDSYFLLTTPTTNIPVNKKHYQHFTKETLRECLKDYFDIEEVIYLNKVSYLERLLNKILANRLYLSHLTYLNTKVLFLYKKYFLVANEYTGSRIYIKAKLKNRDI